MTCQVNLILIYVLTNVTGRIIKKQWGIWNLQTRNWEGKSLPLHPLLFLSRTLPLKIVCRGIVLQNAFYLVAWHIWLNCYSTCALLPSIALQNMYRWQNRSRNSRRKIHSWRANVRNQMLLLLSFLMRYMLTIILLYICLAISNSVALFGTQLLFSILKNTSKNCDWGAGNV